MIFSFVWGVIFGAGTMVILLGHNGMLVQHETEPKHVSPRFVFTSAGCEIDWPSYAKVCHYVDDQGNRLIHTRF